MLRPCRARIVPFVCLAALVYAPFPARAAKWSFGCPSAKERLKSIDKLGTSSAYWLYVHIGHDVVLRHKYAAFSTDPDGNTVELTMLPLGGGDPIPLPPFTVTAVSSSTLQFPAPDTQAILGRLVVGPMKIVVRRTSDNVTVVDSLRNPTLLPRMNDMRALSETNGAVDAFAAVSPMLKAMLVPFTFEEFGPGDPMPGCPTDDLSPVNLFAADFTLKNGADEIIPHLSFHEIKSAKLFFGDYEIFGVNLYGQKLRGVLNARRIPRGGVVACKMNDTYELVMVVKLGSDAFTPSSEILPLIQDGSPLVLHFRNITDDPDVAADLQKVTVDSNKNVCPVPTPSPTATP